MRLLEGSLVSVRVAMIRQEIFAESPAEQVRLRVREAVKAPGASHQPLSPLGGVHMP